MFRVKINKDSNMRKVTTCYGEFHIENDIAISSADNSRRLTKISGKAPYLQVGDESAKLYSRMFV